MTKRLLDRQTRLIHHLTSSGAIFGDAEHRPDPALRGIDRNLLAMEARFSFEKRIEKIAAVLPRTFDLLSADRMLLLREFVKAYPPSDVGRLENARQFCDFLTKRDCREPSGRAPRIRKTRGARVPPYLSDIAACELAMATARLRAEEAPPAKEHSSIVGRVPPRSLRRSRGAVLLRVRYDIRPIFESRSEAIDPVARDVGLAIVAGASGAPPEIFELPSAVFDLLAGLDDWTDAGTFGEWKDAREMTAELVEAGLLEVRR